ncbi:MAG TPA: extracellular solute-binding protein [Clostridiaceae bacterium]|nr:extracellular solute-binding protein [Clostridiaceae bacterium]
MELGKRIPGALKKFILVVLILTITITTVASAADNNEKPLTLKERFAAEGIKFSKAYTDDIYNEINYSDLKAQYEEKGYKPAQRDGAEIEIILDLKNIKTSEQQDIPVSTGVGGKEEEVLVWYDDHEFFEWEFEIEVPGLYEILVEYYPLPSSGAPVIRSFKIDGKSPFIEAHKLELPRFWVDEGEPRLNNVGDEVRPRQKEITGWRYAPFIDSEGFYLTPYAIYFEKGVHTLRVDYVQEPCAIGKIIIRTPDEIPSYAEIKKLYQEKGYKKATQSIKFQAESTAIAKSATTLRRETDGDPMTEPASKGYRKLNVMGGWRWRTGNQSITWEFDVPEDGLYKIGLRMAHWWNNGLPVYRQIMINGEVPFSEMLSYKFVYDDKWRFEYLQDENGEPYLFYLKKGKNTITMTVKLGDYTTIMQDLNKDILLLSQMIRKIIMLTGREPDINFDYQLDRNIPGLLDNFTYISISLQEKIKLLEQISGMRPSMANNFHTISNQLDRMVKDPFTIARRLNDLEQAQTNLGAWLLSMKDNPMLIDYFVVQQPDSKPPKATSSFFQKLWATFRNFIISFYKDYDSVDSVYDEDQEFEEVITVWVARGTEWAEVIKEMADSDFTPKTGIFVNMNVVPPSQMQSTGGGTGGVNALLLSITSGKAPDVALGVSKDVPVEFAIRDAVYELSQFNGFEEVKERFLENIFIPFEYRGGVYAIPDTMDFYVMFYRKDIIDELDITIPDTREDLYNHVLPVLYQNGLEFYYPAEFTQFLYQHGASYYTPDGMRSALDTPEAYMGFKECSELYSLYGIPIVANFYNRFRTGEMPMGLGGYSTYMQLSVAAPEIAGRWDIAPIPGIKKPDGTVDRSVGILAQQANIIMKQSKNPEAAWEFLKWWSSDSVQENFAREIEALVGAEARWNTANIKAFSSLSWDRNHIKVFEDYWKWAKEVPVVLGGYFSSRHISYAWNEVILQGVPVRDALEKAVKEINRELRMKQEEYGIFDYQIK